MEKLSLVFFVSFVCAILLAMTHARYFGMRQNEGFSGIPALNSGYFQNWRYNGLDKRFVFDKSDRFGGKDNRFLDWNQIIGAGRSKKDFGSDNSDGFGLYGIPLGNQRFAFNSGDFSKKSDSNKPAENIA